MWTKSATLFAATFQSKTEQQHVRSEFVFLVREGGIMLDVRLARIEDAQAPLLDVLENS